MKLNNFSVLPRLSALLAAALALLVCSGSLAAVAVDRSFSAELRRDSIDAEVVAVAPDGSVVVNSVVLNSSGVSYAFQIVRLLANGRRDASFSPPSSTGRALARFSDGRLLVAQSPYLLEADGSPSSLTLPPGFDPSAPLRAGLVLPDGKFLIAQAQRLVRYNSDGSVDPSFVFMNPRDGLPVGLQLDAQTRVLVDLYYYFKVGEWTSEANQTVIRLLSSGTEDASFEALTDGYQTRVRVFPLTNGDYLEFSSFQGGARLGLVLRAADSSTVKWGIQPSFALGPLDALSFDPAGRLYVFDHSRTIHRYFIRDEGPVEDPTFALTLTSDPRHSYVLPDGRLLVSGEFDALNEQPTTWIGRLTELSEPYLANLSGRAMSGAGENTVIAGLVSRIPDGSAELPVLLRGAGPSLQPLGVSGYLPNPAIDLYNSKGVVIGNNDQWSVSADSIRAAGTRVGAFPFAENSHDAGLLRTFSSGTATLMLRDQANGIGVGLVEVYRVPDYRVTGELLNLSFRARTAPGEATAIAGFVITDPQELKRPLRLLLRAVGPTLSTQGIVNRLEDPRLTVYNSKGEVIAQNDNWPHHLTAEVAEFDAATRKVGAFPLLPASKDAALLLDLPPGAYTMQATGGTGVVLQEIYLVR